MNISIKIRRGEGPFWSRVKRLALAVLQAHIPVGPLTRPCFRLLLWVHVFVIWSVPLLLRFLWFEPLFRCQCRAVGKHFAMDKLPSRLGVGDIHIGDGVYLCARPSITFGNSVYDAPKLVIGDHTFIGGTKFAIAQSVQIGNHCLVAGGVSIRDYDGHPIDAGLRRAGEKVTAEDIKPVVIGNDVWIGTGAMILKGVHIGDRAVVAAGSVVAKDVAPDTVVAGNPARVVKHLRPSEASSTEVDDALSRETANE